MVRLKNETEPYGSAVYLRKDESSFVGKDELDLNPLRLPDPKACHMAITNGAEESMVNYVPTSEPLLEIPITLESGSTGEFSLNFSGLNKFEEYQCVSLIDEQSGEKIELSENASYPITITQKNSKLNFTLVLSNGDNVNCEPGSAISSENPVHIWANDGQVNADFYLDRSMSATIDIYNTVGQHIHHQENSVSYNRESIQLNQPRGVYFVTVAVHGYTTTEKIILN
jgi:hypothetical protein